MLEIKCPLTRKIKHEGEIDDGICPHYYWVQVQVQLECCNLLECDFWQCDLVEYNNREEYMIDDCKDSNNTIEQNQEIKIDDRIKKGCILEFVPKDKSIVPEKDEVIWYAKYIYPSDILVTEKQYDEWEQYVLSNLSILYPEINEKYEYSRTVYWKLRSSHNVLIKRDREWFNKALPKFRRVWEVIEHYRNNRDHIEEDIVKNVIRQDNYNKMFSAEKFDRTLLQNPKKNTNLLDVFMKSNSNKTNTTTSSSYKRKKNDEDLFLSSDDK